MTGRPTLETDAKLEETWQSVNVPHNPVPADFARRLERERDEAREELDEANKRLIEVCQYGVVCTVEREDLRKELAELKEARK